MLKKIAILALTTVAMASLAVAGEYKQCNADAATCAAKMAAKLKNKGWIGLKFEPTEEGYYRISEVIAESPALAAGFQTGDLVLAVNGVAVSEKNKEGWAKLEKDLIVGADIACKVKRAGAKETIKVTLGQMPEETIATYVGYHVLNGHVQGEKVASN